jgi:SHS2 domain-containing protein
VDRDAPDAGFEILEHTADLGIRAWGPSLEVAFEQAARALVQVLDVAGMGEGAAREIQLSGGDAAGLLVDFLNELVFVAETEEVGFADVSVTHVSDERLEAEVLLVPGDHEPLGMVVKAATYHQLRVEREEGRAEIRVFLDV